MRSKSKVTSPGSRLRESVLDVLKNEGYIRGYAVVQREGRSEIEIELKYFDGEPVIREIERVSKPGRRVYTSVKRRRASITDSASHSSSRRRRSLLADHDARDANVGGEILVRCSDVLCRKRTIAVPSGVTAMSRARPSRSKAPKARCKWCRTTTYLTPLHAWPDQDRAARRDQGARARTGHLAHAGRRSISGVYRGLRAAPRNSGVGYRAAVKQEFAARARR